MKIQFIPGRYFDERSDYNDSNDDKMASVLMSFFYTWKIFLYWISLMTTTLKMVNDFISNFSFLTKVVRVSVRWGCSAVHNWINKDYMLIIFCSVSCHDHDHNAEDQGKPAQRKEELSLLLSKKMYIVKVTVVEPLWSPSRDQLIAMKWWMRGAGCLDRKIAIT